MKGNLGTTTRRHYGAGMKANVAVAAIKGESTTNEIASLHGVHPLQVSKWKRHLLEGAPQLFASGKTAKTEQELIDSLYRQIGQLKVESDWLKKKAGLL